MFSLVARPLGIRDLWKATVSLLLFALLLSPIYTASAAEPANNNFQRTWDRPDKPVSMGLVNRTWMWGPQAFTDSMMESYENSPGGERMVQYYDKSRMEINDPSGDSTSPWYVTNGLLVVELMTGAMQVGDNKFEKRLPAEVNVSGDADDLTAPTYETFNKQM